MKLRLHRNKLLSAKICQDGLDFFESFAQGADEVELEWTTDLELNLQIQAPEFAGWLRAQRLIPIPQLSNLNLANITLVDADLRRADFEGANLDGANLDGADLSRACLIDASLVGASLVDTELEGALFNGVPPDGWAVVGGVLTKVVA